MQAEAVGRGDEGGVRLAPAQRLVGGIGIGHRAYVERAGLSGGQPGPDGVGDGCGAGDQHRQVPRRQVGGGCGEQRYEQRLDDEPHLGPEGAFRLAIQVWPESLRNPVFADLVQRIYTRMREQFVTLARHAVEDGELPPDTDVEAVGAALFGLIPGYALQRILLGQPDPEVYLEGVRSLLGSGRTLA